MSSFKEQNDPVKRREEADAVRLRHPDRVAIIVERAEGSKVPLIDKTKFLVPKDLTVGQFAYVVRRRLKLQPEQALFLMTEAGTMPPTAANMAKIHQEHQDPDGFLYLVYAGENAFG